MLIIDCSSDVCSSDLLEVAPNGGRYWRQKYRFAGKEKRLALGVYPDVSLADARVRRDEARRRLASGVDPGVQRRASSAARAGIAADSFEIIAREWLASRPWVDGYQTKVEAWMVNDVVPWIGSRRAGEPEAPHFLPAGNEQASVRERVCQS